MSFLGHLPPLPEETIDEPGVMHIGGARGQRLKKIARRALILLAIAGVMVISFIRFGATTLWAFGLVAFMLGYMLLMGRWAGKN